MEGNKETRLSFSIPLLPKCKTTREKKKKLDTRTEWEREMNVFFCLVGGCLSLLLLLDVGVGVAILARRGASRRGGLSQGGQLLHDVFDLGAEPGRRRRVGSGWRGQVRSAGWAALGSPAPMPFAVEVLLELGERGELFPFAGEAFVLEEDEPGGSGGCFARGALVLGHGRLAPVQGLAGLTKDTHLHGIGPDAVVQLLRAEVLLEAGSAGSVERESGLGHARLAERLGDLLEGGRTPLEHGQHVVLRTALLLTLIPA